MGERQYAEQDSLHLQIEEVWEKLSHHEEVDESFVAPLLMRILQGLERGEISVVAPPEWTVNVWVKKAILLMFRFLPSRLMGEWPGLWFDKIPLQNFQEGPRPRVVPGAWIRQGAFIDPSAVIMPSFINMGAHIGARTMIDSGASIGSCAFVGDRCHISSTVTIGGVLEPLQNHPVIIEDECFVGAGCHVLEGVHIEQGAVLGAGVVLAASTKIVDRHSQRVTYGRIPAGAVVVPGSHSAGTDGILLQCAVIIKTVDQKTRAKTSLTDLLRS